MLYLINKNEYNFFTTNLSFVKFVLKLINCIIFILYN